MISSKTASEKLPTVPLGDLVEFLDNQRRPVKESERISGPYPYYGANGLQGTVNDYIFDEPLILLAEDGGHFNQPDRGIAYQIAGKAWVNNHAHVLRPKKGTNLGYIRRVLENYDVTPFVTGTTRGKLTKSAAWEIRIPMMSLEDQRCIAAILDQAEALRAKRRHAIAQVDKLAKSAFIDTFGDPVLNSKKWTDSLTLGDTADIVSGITKGRKLGDTKVRSVPYLAVSNVQDRRLDLDTTKFIDATEDEIKRYTLRKNDLLLTEGGDPDKLGRGTLWNEELPECIHQNHIFRVRLHASASLHPLFVSWLVASQRGKQYFLRSAKQTTGIASINMTQLRGFPLLLPPLVLQQKFATQVAAIERLKFTHRASLAKLDALFASLQHRAFRGELRPGAEKSQLGLFTESTKP